jgi:hypothetical protein
MAHDNEGGLAFVDSREQRLLRVRGCPAPDCVHPPAGSADRPAAGAVNNSRFSNVLSSLLGDAIGTQPAPLPSAGHGVSQHGFRAKLHTMASA